MSDFFDTEIAACTAAIENIGGKNPNGKTFDNYLKRGVMRCLNQPEKGGRCSSATEDLTIALHLQPNDTNALYYQAYAYFISEDYGSAVDECKKGLALNSAIFHELLGNIYFAQRNYNEAKTSYREAIEESIKVTPMPMLSSSLLENYRKACAKARGN
jgi:tetratricopeptide (TPR) repeat protein